MWVGGVLFAECVPLLHESEDLWCQSRFEVWDFSPGDVGFGSLQESIPENFLPL